MEIIEGAPASTRCRAQTLSACGSSCYLWIRILCRAATHDGAFPIRPLYLLTGVMIGAYAFGLLRAWELLGVRRFGLTNWLISPLRSTNEKAPLRTTEQPETTSKIPRD